MKKRTVAILGLLTLIITATGGCAKSADQAAPEASSETIAEAVLSEDTPQQEDEAGAEEETMTGIANPWVGITEEEANKLCPRLFKAPEGAKVLEWLKCESLGDPDKNIGPMIQLNFEYDDMEFTARAQYGVAEDADISGVYAQWVEGPDETTLANWGEGNMKGTSFRAIDDLGTTDLITWYDIEIGIKYSLCVTAEDLDGFDIQSVAELMYSADNEPEVP